MNSLRRHQSLLLLAMTIILLTVQVGWPGLATAQIEDKPKIDIKAVEAHIKELRASSGSWKYADLINRGRLAMVQMEWGQAAAFFETSAAMHDITADERAAAWFLQGLSLRMSAQARSDEADRKRGYVESAQLMNQAQMQFPDNGTIAANRLAGWLLAGDELETMIARQHLNSLDGQLTGQEVVATPVAALYIVVKLVVFGVWLVERIEPGYFTDNELFEFLTFTDELLVQLGIIQEAIEIYMY